MWQLSKYVLSYVCVYVYVCTHTPVYKCMYMYIMYINSVHTEQTCGLGLASLLHKHVTPDFTET